MNRIALGLRRLHRAVGLSTTVPILCGAGSIVYGVHRLWGDAAYIAGGVLAIVLVFLAELGRNTDSPTPEP